MIWRRDGVAGELLRRFFRPASKPRGVSREGGAGEKSSPSLKDVREEASRLRDSTKLICFVSRRRCSGWLAEFIVLRVGVSPSVLSFSLWS